VCRHNLSVPCMWDKYVIPKRRKVQSTLRNIKEERISQYKVVEARNHGTDVLQKTLIKCQFVYHKSQRELNRMKLEL